MTKTCLGLLLAAAVGITAVLTASPDAAVAAPRQAAQDSGMVALHTLRRERGLVCMTDHYHIGTSYGLPSKSAAERAALADFASFTAWEYGNHWGNARVAGSRTMNCKITGGTWGCEFNARPCRR